MIVLLMCMGIARYLDSLSYLCPCVVEKFVVLMWCTLASLHVKSLSYRDTLLKYMVAFEVYHDMTFFGR